MLVQGNQNNFCNKHGREVVHLRKFVQIMKDTRGSKHFHCAHFHELICFELICHELMIFGRILNFKNWIWIFLDLDLNPLIKVDLDSDLSPCFTKDRIWILNPF